MKVGDIVELVSDGPPMTIVFTRCTAPGHLDVDCAWFVGDDLRHATFPSEGLRPHIVTEAT